MAMMSFLAAVSVAVMLTVTALVVWLAAVMNSMLGATLAVAGAATTVAIVIYLVSLRRPLQRIADKIDTVYEVAEVTREVGEWVVTRLPLILTMRDLLFKNEKSDAN